jgi:hypothetical protein
MAAIKTVSRSGCYEFRMYIDAELIIIFNDFSMPRVFMDDFGCGLFFCDKS